MIVINTAKAVEIAKNALRVWRDGEFKNNDVALQNALVDGRDTSDLILRREYLRDLPNECEGKSIEELSKILEKVEIKCQ